MLFTWKESYDKPRQHIKKQRHHFANKARVVKAMFFSSSLVWMWEWYHKEDWSFKNDAFELWYWRRLFRVPWTARRSNQSILKQINPDYSLEGPMLKLKLWYFGHLMWRADSLVKTLMLGKIQGGRRRGQQRMRWLDGITDSIDMSEQAPGDGEGQGSLACCSPWGHKELDTTEQMNNNKDLAHI